MANKLGAWVKTHRGPAIAIGGAGAVGLALLLKSRSGSKPTSTPTTTVTPTTPADAGYSSAASDAYNSIEPQIAALQAALASQAASQPSSGAPPATPPPASGPGIGGAAPPMPSITPSVASGGYTQTSSTNLVGFSPNDAAALGIVPIQVAASPQSGRGPAGSPTNPGINLPPASGSGRFYETPPVGGKSYGFVYG